MGKDHYWNSTSKFAATFARRFIKSDNIIFMESKELKTKSSRRITPFSALIVVVAVAAYLSQLSINAYYKIEGTNQNIKREKDDAVKAFYGSPSYVSRYAADTLVIGTLNRLAAQKEIRNAKQLEQNGRLKHDGSILALADSIKTVTMSRESWAKVEISKIESRYRDTQDSKTTKWGGLGLVFVFETLGVMFGFMAAKRQRFYILPFFKNPVRAEMWVCLAASFYAQRTSCLITEQALILLVGNADLSASYANAFMFLCPLYFIIGGFQIDESAKVQPMATITRRTASVSLSHELTETTQQVPANEIKSVEPKNGDEAILLYAKGIIGPDARVMSGTERLWTIRKIACDFFGGESKRTHVHNLIKTARDNSGQEFVTS